jgi:type I restriction enzyme R subunit
MWLTGFDAPCTHTMYIDKPMKGHNLMQAIARVNRVFKDKQGGLVVDYIGIANELKQALKTYTDAKGKGEPTLRAEEAYAVLAEKMDAIRGMFAKTNEQVGMDLSAYETQAHRLIIPAANYVLSLKDGKKRFLDLVWQSIKPSLYAAPWMKRRTCTKKLPFTQPLKRSLASIPL